jgi:hypothetical protein
MQKKSPAVSVDPRVFGKEGKFADKVAYYLLWFEYLAVSPSYELARRFWASSLRKTGKSKLPCDLDRVLKIYHGLDEEEKAKLPSDFDTVLKVYGNLGDVQHIRFQPWWIDRGLDHFGYHGQRPRVNQISYVAQFKEREPYFADAANKFIDGFWREQGRQRTMIVAIPIGLTRGRITKQINAMLSRYPVEKRKLHVGVPTYSLEKKKLHRKALFRYLSVLWHRGLRPDDLLWKIGARADISRKYSEQLLKLGELRRHQFVGKKDALKILTSRALARGRMIAENAARGIFPSYKKCDHAVEIDLEALNRTALDRMRKRRQPFKKAEKQRAGEAPG